MQERPIPEAAFRDNNSVELMRIWIADKGFHCSLKIGMYYENKKDEEAAWGIILADAIRHISMALESKYSLDRDNTAKNIRNSLLNELERPTSIAEGAFRKRKPN